MIVSPAGPQQHEYKDGPTERRPSTSSSCSASHDSSFNLTRTNKQKLAAPIIEDMEKHVREVTEQPYRDLKSPFRDPAEGPRRDLKLDEIFTNLIIYEGRVKYDFSGGRMEQLKEYNRAAEILGFTTEQVNDYVGKFTKLEDKAETIKKHITSNLNLLAFCYIPAIRFIICSCLLELLGNTTGLISLPTRLTEIYSTAIKMFYFSYDDGQYRHNKTDGEQFFLKPFKDLPPSVQKVFTSLGKIAFDGIKQGRLVFESGQVTDLESNGLFHRLPDTRDDPLEEGKDQYCFLHLTIQEFLAAKYLVDTSSSEKLGTFVSDHIQDGAWMVVMQFVAGLLAEEEEKEEEEGGGGEEEEEEKEEEGQSTDIFSGLLPSATFTDEVPTKENEDSEERTETVTYWPEFEDKVSVVTLFNCMYENNAFDRKVQKKLAEIRCNGLNFTQCSLSPFDCVALVRALKSVEGILDFDLNDNNLQSLGCIEIAKLLRGNEHNQGFCRQLNLSQNQITDKGVEQLSAALTHTNCKLSSLNLWRNKITDKGVEYLSAALTHTNCKINSLNLSDNKITDKGVEYLSAALKHPDCKLNSLILSDNQTTDKGVNSIYTALKHNGVKKDPGKGKNVSLKTTNCTVVLSRQTYVNDPLWKEFGF